MKHNTVFVSWSGGMDSSFLIDKTLREKPNITVKAGYIKIENNKAKVVAELNAIDKLSKIFRDKYGNRFIYEGTLMSVDVVHTPPEVCLKQLPIWLLGLFMSAPRQVDEIQLSYVMNDDAVSYINDIKKIWKSFKSIGHGDFPPITFPLLKWGKQNIARELSDDIRFNVWWCETPYQKDDGGNFIPCGECVPCKHSPLLKLSEKITAKKEYVKECYPQLIVGDVSFKTESDKSYKFGIKTNDPYELSTAKH